MPQHREEPRIYSGKVVIMIGNDAGNTVPMDYTVAQAMVASGQARWTDDTSPMPRHLAAQIAERDRVRNEEIAADAAHNQALKDAAANGGQSADPQGMQPGDFTGGRPLNTRSIGGVVYLSSPFPQRLEITQELAKDTKDALTISIAENAMVIILANAEARYEIVAGNEDFLYCELVEATMPEIDLPDNWRERAHIANIGAAKKLYQLDPSHKLTKADAEQYLEDWTRSYDDQVPPEGAGSEPGVPTNENGRKLDGNHEGPKTEDENGKPILGEDGNPAVVKTPAEIAAEAERKIVEDADDD